MTGVKRENQGKQSDESPENNPMMRPIILLAGDDRSGDTSGFMGGNIQIRRLSERLYIYFIIHDS